MKKALFIAIIGLSAPFGYAQTATNWTVNDCSQVPHTLFSELDAGKVVVITWVMPCGACIGPASTAATSVMSMGNPNVVFYLVDDYGNSSCSTIESWASSNFISATAKFSSTAINMMDYGSTGMPKTVVLGGGTCHTVYFNQNGSFTQAALQTAIGLASTPCGIGVKENQGPALGLRAFPNPAGTHTRVQYVLSSPKEVTLEITSVLGEKVLSIPLEKQSAGEQEVEIPLTSLAAGWYMLRLHTDDETETMKVLVAR